MTDAADKLARTSFGVFSFPVAQHTVHLRVRHHIHEYPHSPGGAPEKLGRGLYGVTMRVLFHDTFDAYPDLYPNTMNSLRKKAETQETDSLVHPSLGTIQAFIIDWRQVKESKIRSGETVDIEFLEDTKEDFAINGIFVASQNSVDDKAKRLADELASVRDQLSLSDNSISLFSAVQSMANAVLAVKDTAGLYGNLLAAKVAQLTNICSQLNDATELQNPLAWPVVDALRDLWAVGLQIQNDLQDQRVQLRTYVVPQTMSMAQVAVTLYGDASRQSDLLALNATILNSLSVRAGTSLNYYPT